jgi:Uma2 family endonuclease
MFAMNSPMKSLHKYSYREFQYFPNDGFRHEIIDGEHYMSPAPSTKHQTVSRRLQFQIYSQIELTGLGQVFNAPTDVELAPHDIVEPDLILVMNDRVAIITPSRILGVPNLLIEILSPSNPNHDRILKFEMYARTGVSEYWIVDPEEESVAQWVLKDGSYKLLGSHHDSVNCNCVQAISVDLRQVWQ